LFKNLFRFGIFIVRCLGVAFFLVAVYIRQTVMTFMSQNPLTYFLQMHKHTLNHFYALACDKYVNMCVFYFWDVHIFCLHILKGPCRLIFSGSC